MPIIDYVCTSCSHVDSTFVPASLCGNDHPESEVSTCTVCSSRSDRNYSGASPSTGFLVPPVVHYNKKTGQYSIPGNRDDEVDRGYERVEIRDMAMYNRLVKSVNSFERENAQYLQQQERDFFDQRLKEQRAERKRVTEEAVRKGGYWAEWTDDRGHLRREWRPVTGRALALLDASQRYADKSIAARRQRVASSVSSGANFHSRIIEHNKSEQSIVDGAGKKATFFFGSGRR